MAKIADDAWKMFIDTAGAMIADRDQEALVSFTKFVDQLPLVFGQVYKAVSYNISWDNSRSSVAKSTASESVLSYLCHVVLGY